MNIIHTEEIPDLSFVVLNLILQSLCNTATKLQLTAYGGRSMFPCWMVHFVQKVICSLRIQFDNITIVNTL